MNEKWTWRIGFLSLTAGAIAAELWAIWDHDGNTEPWTSLIVDHVPWQATLAVFGALLLWLPAHFIVAYRKRQARLKRAGIMLVAEQCDCTVFRLAHEDTELGYHWCECEHLDLAHVGQAGVCQASVS